MSICLCECVHGFLTRKQNKKTQQKQVKKRDHLPKNCNFNVNKKQDEMRKRQIDMAHLIRCILCTIQISMESSKDLRNDIEIAYNSYASPIKESLKGKTGIFTFKYDRKRKTQTVKNSERRLRTVFDSGKKRQAN